MNVKESKNKKKVNVANFSSDFTKESVYILGLLWADGHIREEQRLTSINFSENDVNDVENVFKKTGEWLISKPITKMFNGKKVKNQKKISTTTWGLFEFLKENDYIIKSRVSPNKILSIIPRHLVKYWFRGYLDGDGCVKIGKKYGVEIVFAGSYEQDWGFLISLCGELGVDFSIDKRIVKKGKYSHFRVNKKNHVKKMCDYIYENYDNIGFTRKYNKYLQVVTYIMEKEKIFWTNKDVKFLMENYKKLGGKKCAEFLKKDLSSVYNKIRSIKKNEFLNLKEI